MNDAEPHVMEHLTLPYVIIQYYEHIILVIYRNQTHKYKALPS